MSLSEEKKILLSQLVDGELPVDQANQVLGEVLDELSHVQGSAEATRQLHAMIQLRRTLGPWRRQEPSKTIVLPSSVATAVETSNSRWHVMSLASAALLGGVLVAGGFLLSDLLAGRRLDTTIARQDTEPTTAEHEKVLHKDRQPVVVITPEQRRDIARAFALHESVAGPLSWYAADDTTIQVAPAEKGGTMQEPIAVVLRLSRDPSSPNGKNSQPKTYVIVCRNHDMAAIQLPSSAMTPNLQLRLFSKETGGRVNLRYALAAGGTGRELDDAALVGQRHVDLGQTSLGQLALNDLLVNVDASAWVIGSNNNHTW
ncbi:MAG: hypothetical protein ABFC77_00300 [Thermoguttaceae bacterium]